MNKSRAINNNGITTQGREDAITLYRLIKASNTHSEWARDDIFLGGIPA